MKFSIRELLALTFLVVLGMLAWRTLVDVRKNRERVLRLQGDIRSLELQARMNDPAVHQAMLHARDEFESLRVMRDRSIEHFELIRKKYSTIEPVQADVLAVRAMPSLSAGAAPAPVIFRLLVPEERDVWLKFGVHKVKQSRHSSRSSDQESDLLTESPFEDSGPFEMQLPAGDQTLTITTGSVVDDSVPLEIKLGDKVLLSSAFVAANVTESGSHPISALRQINFGPRRPLPWILTANMSLRDPTSGQRPVMSYGFSVWLSDRSSNYESFRGE